MIEGRAGSSGFVRTALHNRALFDALDEGICTVEVVFDDRGTAVDYRFLEANLAFERQTGLQQAVGRRMRELAPDHEEFWFELYGQVAVTGEAKRFEHEAVALGRFYDVYAFRIGEPQDHRVTIIFNDIRARKQAEHALRESEERSQLLLLASSEMVYRMSADWTRMYLLVGKGILADTNAPSVSWLESYIPNSEKAFVQGAIDKAIKSKAVFELEHQVVQEDGTIGWTLSRAIPVLDEQGEIIEWFGAASDITERKRVEETLRQNEARQTFLVQLGDAVRPLASAVEIEAAVTRIAMGHFRADRCYYCEIGVGQAVIHQDAAREGLPSVAGTYLLEEFTLLKTVIDNERNFVVHDVRTAESMDEELRQLCFALQVTSFLNIPVVKVGQVVGVLCLVQSTPRDWADVEISLAEEIAERVWAAVERARAEKALQELNTTLGVRVEERTRRLADLNLELTARTHALEVFAQLTRGLALETDRYALVKHVQATLLTMLPPAHTGYFELKANVWHMKSEAGDLRSDKLRALLNAGLPLESPGPFVPFSTGRPEYLDAFTPRQDTPLEMARHIRTTAGLPILLRGLPIGVLLVGLFEAQPWQPVDKIVLETAAQHLTLALERAEAVRALDEEREALAAFARFTELAADTSDVGTLAQQAIEVLRTTLNVTSAVYFELRDGAWKARWVAGSVQPGVETQLYAGLSHNALSFTLPAARRESMFFEPLNAAEDGVLEANRYRAAARYPLFPQGHPVGILGMASIHSDAWTEREKAVFQAVGDSFHLALGRAASTLQIERQRERLADLNAELGNLITRTAHNLEEPARRLSHLLEPPGSSNFQALWNQPSYDPVALSDEVKRLKGVALDLRQLSILEEHPLTKEPLPLGELFAELSATPPGSDVTWQIGALPIVRGDRALLQQALSVLLTFTLSETRGARYVTVSSRQIEGEVQVSVQDDGVGLSGEEAATLFDLAMRTEESVPVLEGGGLVQVRRILARHGGWAWAESQRSSGKVVLAFPKDAAVSAFEALFRHDKPGM